MFDALNIRSLLPTDFTRWATLWEGYNSFYGRSGFVVYRKTF